MSTELIDTIGTGIISVGWIMAVVFLITALVKKAERDPEHGVYYAYAFVSVFACWLIGLIFMQTLKFGFVDGMLGILGGIVILIALICFIAWLFNAT